MTTLENLLFARGLAEHHAGTVKRFVVFCDSVHRRKVATLSRLLLGTQTIVHSVDHNVAFPIRLFEPVSHFLEAVVALAPRLASLDANEPAAAEIRKLVGEQLPEFIKGYERVPSALRGVERNGKSPDQQLVEGLSVIGREIDEMAAQLAQGDLDALSTRGRYLEIKYQGDKSTV